jgi:hypothetical protein
MLITGQALDSATRSLWAISTAAGSSPTKPRSRWPSSTGCWQPSSLRHRAREKIIRFGIVRASNTERIHPAARPVTQMAQERPEPTLKLQAAAVSRPSIWQSIARRKHLLQEHLRLDLVVGQPRLALPMGARRTRTAPPAAASPVRARATSGSRDRESSTAHS